MFAAGYKLIASVLMGATPGKMEGVLKTTRQISIECSPCIQAEQTFLLFIRMFRFVTFYGKNTGDSG